MVQRIKRIRGFIGALLIFQSSLAIASTFVGNGGSTNDLDLDVTRAEVVGALRGVSKRNTQLCECPEKWSTHGACQILKKLTPTQKEMCVQTLKAFGDKVAGMAGFSSDLSYHWSDDRVLRAADSQGIRNVDAIAQTNVKRVVIKRDNFLELSRTYRIVLITHELFHFIEFKNGYVKDQLPYGPYTTGKSFLDALGAATAVEAHVGGISEDLAELEDVSRSDRNVFLRLDLGKAVTRNKATQKSLLLNGSAIGSSFSGTYRFSNFGLKLGSETQTSSGSRRQFSVSENIWLATAGVGFFMKPINRQLSRWNEIMIALNCDIASGKSFYKINDQELTLSDSAKVIGAQISFDLYIPLNGGFWGNLGLQYRELKYRFRNLNVDVNDHQTIAGLGVSYGF